MIWLGKRYTAAHLRWLTGANTERGGLDRGLRLFGVSVGWLFLGVAHSTREARSESSQPEATPPSATETVDPRREAKSASASEPSAAAGTLEGERLTLDEAILHAEAKAGETPCGANHAQLAAWLRELRSLRAAPSPRSDGPEGTP